ncbi:MAG TPA: hypothetical protein VMQ11_17925 [Alphaproteobacteria bacterium]|nr:hypothetical protein [Alphaproteobacteria bacterium]
MRPLLRTAAIAIAVAGSLGAAAGRAAANPMDTPLSRETFQDHMRCDALTQQFDRAAAQHPVADAAKKQASQGAVLCRAGHYGEGADTLEKAVRMLGEAPAK